MTHSSRLRLVAVGALVACALMAAPRATLASESSSETSSSSVPVATAAPQYCFVVNSAFPGAAAATWLDGGVEENALRKTFIEAWTTAGSFLGLELNANNTQILSATTYGNWGAYIRTEVCQDKPAQRDLLVSIIGSNPMIIANVFEKDIAPITFNNVETFDLVGIELDAKEDTKFGN